MTKKVENFHKAISQILVEKLAQYRGKSTTKDICMQIYQTIFLSLQEIFVSSNVTLTNEAMNYLAQQYYDGVTVNGRDELDPNIFTVRASLDNIETKEIALMAMLLKGTDFAYPLYEKIRSRS